MLDIEFAQADRLRPGTGPQRGLPGVRGAGDPARCQSRGWLFALADGVGGQEQGEVASRLAVETLLAGFRERRAGESLSRPAAAAGAGRPMPRSTKPAWRRGPGGVPWPPPWWPAPCATTARWSRTWAIRAATWSGTATPKRSRAITRWPANKCDWGFHRPRGGRGLDAPPAQPLAGQRHVRQRGYAEHQLIPGDVLLLCSDGLHGAVDAGRHRAHRHPRHFARGRGARADRLANERDGSDNVSVQLIRVRNVERVGMYRGRPYKLA